MNHILAITKKELRAYFLSPIALIFLGSFLLITLFAFFTTSQFWVRNLADARPLFSALPVVLIFLVGALTMRLWSEEQKLGTLEILLTFPVKIHSLVLGKFLAGLVLVALALALTLHVPIIVSMHGDLDWGPVAGGYVGALLLASSYLAIGLCISSITKNQVVALILTWAACGLLYLVGSDTIAGYAGTAGGEILRAIGSGSRFESIGRGVIDLRDLVYYGSLTVSFLVLNAVMLHAKGWSDGARTRKARTNAKLMVALTAANLLALNVWMHGVHLLRLDMTERGEFSISSVTEDLIVGLNSPLLIRGYFSSKSHPLLDPLVPRIRDLIEEYGAISGGNVTTEFVDPKDDEDVEKEANQNYGIKSFPFQVASRYESGVVNSYFSILVKYGDQYETLDFRDLIEINATGNEPEVKLRNLEYDLTRAIKKVAYGFQTLDAVFADITDEVEFTGYITPATLPENFKDVPKNVEKVLVELEASSSGKFKYSVVDPTAPENAGMQDKIYKTYGFRPMAVGLMSPERFYLHLLLRVGDRYERIMPNEGMAEADLKKEITAALKRSTPGFLKTVGIVKPKTGLPTPPAQPGRPPPQPPDIIRGLGDKLGENYTVREVNLKKGRVPGDIDVLLAVQPEDLAPEEVFGIDQYLMRGGAVVVLAGSYKIDLASQQAQQGGLVVKKVKSGLEDALAAYGVTVEDTMVMDPQNEKFPVPKVRDLGGFKVQQVELVNYPYFIDVRADGMDKSTPVLAGLPGVTLHWVSPLTVTTPEIPQSEDDEEEAKPKREVVELLKSTDGAWTRAESNVQPDFRRFPEDGFGTGDETKTHVLGVAIHGTFFSAFHDKPNPTFGDGGGSAEARTGRTIKSSPDTARLVVIGSGNFINDAILGIAQRTGGDRATSNLQLVENTLDWAVSDVDLLTIRSRGTFARTLAPMEPDDRKMWEAASYGIGLLLLVLFVALTMGGRKRMKPLTLVGGKAKSPPSSIGGKASEASS